MASCDQAATLLSAQEGPSAVGWRATFGAHRSLALLLQLRLGGDTDAAAGELPAQLHAQLEARREETESLRSEASAAAGAGAASGADANAAFQVASAAVEGTHLLLGDAHHLAGNGAEAQESWVDHANELAEATLYTRANSWYMGANTPGKPRMFLAYVGGVGAYRLICDQIAATGYHGFDVH